MKRVLFFVFAASLVGGAARADRHAHAQALFRSRCATCHDIGWGELPAKPREHIVDLTHTADRHDERWLRAWLKNPNAQKPDTPCYTAGLDPVQIDLLIGFFATHTKKISRQIVIPKPPPAARTEGEGGRK